MNLKHSEICTARAGRVPVPLNYWYFHNVNAFHHRFFPLRSMKQLVFLLCVQNPVLATAYIWMKSKTLAKRTNIQAICNCIVCVCVCQPLCQRVHCQLLPFSQQGAIPLPSGGWPTKRPLGGAANVPAELLYKLSLHSFFVCFHGGSCYFP